MNLLPRSEPALSSQILPPWASIRYFALVNPIPLQIQACHTAIVDGYMIEGHVPVEKIERLLNERPEIVGLTVRGMPPDSPGMENGGSILGSFDVISFDGARITVVYSSYSERCSSHMDKRSISLGLRFTKIMERSLIIFVVGLLLSGCFAIRRNIVPTNPMSEQERRLFTDNIFTSKGEQIYFTAINERGQRLRYSGVQNFGGMMMGMGTNLACVSCHGSDGRGGIHTMHMAVMDAPDIRYSSLSSEEDEHEGDHAHKDEHDEYDLEAFRLAVVEGVHPDGESLSRDMPRWRMSDEDLEDLFDYLKSLH